MNPLLVRLSWLRLALVAVIMVVVLAAGWLWRRESAVESKTLPSPTLLVLATNPPVGTPTPTPTITSTPTATVPPATATPYVHIVQSGETVSAIAATYGVDVDVLMALNNLDDQSARRLSMGQELILMPAGPVGTETGGGASGLPAPVPARQIIHVVQTGDTLSSIASDYGAKLDAIFTANGLTGADLIHRGQEIVVPLDPPTPTPTQTPTPSPTPTPGPPFAAPHLVYPVEGQRFSSANASVVLLWTSVGLLAKDQAYLVVLDAPGREEPVTVLTRDTSWRLPADIWPTGSNRTFRWQVVVVPVDPQTQEMGEGRPLSQASSSRSFNWD